MLATIAAVAGVLVCVVGLAALAIFLIVVIAWMQSGSH